MKKYTLSFLLILGLVFQFYLPSMFGAESKTDQSAPFQKVDCFDSITPFINKDTILVAHVNLGQFDFEKLAETLRVQLRANMKTNQFDKESTAVTEKEFNVMLERIIAMGKPAVNSFFKNTNLKDIFIVVPDIKQVKYSCIILPLDNKNEEQTEAINALLKQFNAPNINFKKKYILIPFEASVIDDDDMTLAAFFSKTFKPGKNKQLEQAFSDHPEQTLCVSLSSFNLEQFAKDVDGTDLFEKAEESPIKIIPLLTIIKESFKNAVLTIDLNTLGSSLEVEFTEQEGVEQFQKELFTIQQAAISLWLNEIVSQMENEDNPVLMYIKAFKVFPFVQAYVNGMFNTLHPKQEKNKIIFSGQANGNPGITTVPVIGALVGILLPAVQSSRDAARRMQCTNNLKQIALAMHNYHDANKSFPPAFKADADGKPLHSWRVLILPYLESSALYGQIRLNEPWDSEWNSQFHSQMPQVYGCTKTPKDTKKGLTHVSVIIGKETPFTGSKGTKMSAITNGTSNTIMVIERDQAVCWMAPDQELSCKELQKSGFKYPCTLHENGGIAANCDGSVRFMSKDFDPDEFKNAVIKNNEK